MDRTHSNKSTVMLSVRWVLRGRSMAFRRISDQITFQARLKEREGAGWENIPEEGRAMALS